MSEGNGRIRTVAALVVVVLSLGFAYHRWSALHPKGITNAGPRMGSSRGGPGGPPADGPAPGSRPGPGGPDPMMADLGLTEEQRTQLEAARKAGGNDFRKMREALDKVLTAEQRDKMRQNMEKRRAEMDARLKRTLGEKDFADFKKRMEEMRQGGMGPPGGPPPPPPGQ